jgi:predicted RNA-binding Zn-ribbon protein involved in translation (DUF1610 family)
MTVVIKFPLLECGDVLSIRNRRIRTKSYRHLQIKVLFSCPEYGDSNYIQNTGKFLTL